MCIQNSRNIVITDNIWVGITKWHGMENYEDKIIRGL